MGAALFQVSPAGTFVVCFVARVLMGLCTALIFNALRKAMPKNEKLACFLVRAGAEHRVLHGLSGTDLL